MVRSLAVAVLLIASCGAWGQESPARVIPPPAADDPHPPGHSEKAVLAGGCYWGTQGIFEHVKGVRRVVAGFAGGHSDEDGGAESVMITFDPRVISYGRLLQIFFSVVHDPTQLDRQGPDAGPGYRSDIFYMNAEQHRIAQA
ncbi:MAG TPA: peptide-methionine (S)-S-oxide reductase, partial [Steroidobacteraceae bacterium]|nr:peptide-methionine (S)-S-oxide reductase [Steroidobacteraceae bacterium]